MSFVSEIESPLPENVSHESTHEPTSPIVILACVGMNTFSIVRRVDFAHESVNEPEKGWLEIFVISTRSSVPSYAISVTRKRGRGS